MAHDGQRGREAGDLALPVADHRGRAHEKRITPVLGTRRAAVEQEGEELDRLPEPHVVGETGAEAEVGHPGEPGKPPLLIGAERAAEIPGDGDAVRAEPPAQPGNYARELPLGDDVDGQPRLRPPRRLPERHRDRLVRGEGSPARSEEPPRLLELLRIDRHPLAAEAHERRLEAGERDELARGEHLARERRLPAERHDLVE